MFLRSLRLNNFRSFYGDQLIEFAPVSDKAVTVIHGENGSGKTNLLNALFWCLSGSFTPRLSNPELLINKTAHDEDRAAPCFVETSFSHEGRQYLARRTVLSRHENRLEVFGLEDETPGAPIPRAQNFLDRIFPKGLSRWFFFDAEAIGELELSGSDRFKMELRRVLGFELVDVLLEDLEKCLTKKQRNLVATANSKELNEILTEIENIEHVLPNQRAKASELEEQIRKVDADITAIAERLRELPKSRPLQEQRAKLEVRRKAKVQARKEIQEQVARFIGDTAPGVLLSALAAPFEDQLHVKENSGRLPAPYSEQLVEDILRDQLCICGRDVAAHSREEEKIRGLLRTASTNTFNSRVRNIQYLLKDLSGARQYFAATSADLEC